MFRRRSTLPVIAALAMVALVAFAGRVSAEVANSRLFGGRLHPPTRLVIPKIDVDSAVTPVGIAETDRGLEWNTVDQGVGWHRNSSTPGMPGNTVLSGHNLTRGDRVFKSLWKLKIGDRFTVYVGDEAHDYVVTEREVFREFMVSEITRARNAAWIGQFPDERVTLFTCHPTWTNTHRLVVVGRPVKAGEQVAAH